MNRFSIISPPAMLLVLLCGAVATAQTAAPVDPAAATPWTYEHAVTNRNGTTSNAYRAPFDHSGTPVAQQRMVANPRGEMIQTRERTRTQEGHTFQRTHTFTAPDGTVLRQHESTRTMTGPGNFAREHQVTLPDRRTMTQTQTHTRNGETGTMGRTFTGPNGQTQEFQRTPDASAKGSPRNEGSKWFGWLEKFNPFRNTVEAKHAANETGNPNASPPPPRRGGFTVGAGTPRGPRLTPRGFGQTQPGHPNPTARRVRVGQLTPRAFRHGASPR